MKRLTTLIPMLAMALAACAGPGLFASEPMGKQLDRVRKQLEDQCRADGTPPFGPNKPGQFETACLMFALKPWEIGDTPESAFAHSIKLPSPHDKPKNVYKAGMSSEDYFKALCKEEAGEWVFGRAEGVEGFRQERPRMRFPIGYSGIAFYAIEQAPYMDSDLQEYFVAPPIGRYSYLEIRNWRASSSDPNSRYSRYFKEAGAPRLQVKQITLAEANYALVWRGVRRENDRENAIDGFEIVIYRVSPFEVLAFRRGFNYRYLDQSTRDFRTPSGGGCPGGTQTPPKFVESILIPAKQR